MSPLQVRANADWRVFPCGHMTCAECFARLLCARTACCPLCRLPLLERARVAPGAPGRPAARAAWLQRVILHYVHARAAPLLERRSSAVHSLCRGSRTLWLATAYQHAGHDTAHATCLGLNVTLVSARVHMQARYPARGRHLGQRKLEWAQPPRPALPMPHMGRQGPRLCPWPRQRRARRRLGAPRRAQRAPGPGRPGEPAPPGSAPATARCRRARRGSRCRLHGAPGARRGSECALAAA